MPVTALAQALEALADTVELGGRAADVPGQLQQLERTHASQAERAPGPDMAQLATVLRAWAEVWGRLGSDPAFRGAMAREARAWAKRCA